MITTKPPGADGWRYHTFVSFDGSGRNLQQAANFMFTEDSYHKLFRGPNIVSTSDDVDCLITTAEPHGFQVGEEIRIQNLPFSHAALNEKWVLLTVPSATTFTIGYDASALAPTTGRGVVGVDIGTRMNTSRWDIVVGGIVKDGYPEFWQALAATPER